MKAIESAEPAALECVSPDESGGPLRQALDMPWRAGIELKHSSGPRRKSSACARFRTCISNPPKKKKWDVTERCTTGLSELGP